MAIDNKNKHNTNKDRTSIRNTDLRNADFRKASNDFRKTASSERVSAASGTDNKRHTTNTAGQATRNTYNGSTSYKKSYNTNTSEKRLNTAVSEKRYSATEKKYTADYKAGISKKTNTPKGTEGIKKNTGKKQAAYIQLTPVSILLIAAAALIVFAVIFVAVKIKSYNSPQLGKGDGEVISVKIEEGASVRTIADILKDGGVIDSRMHFLYLCKKNNVGEKFHAGVYKLKDNMTFEELTAKLETGGFNDERIKFTIIEGQWLTEIANNLEKTGFCTAEEFIAECNSRDYDYDFVKAIPNRDRLLEGYLYPDTYFIDYNLSVHDVVDIFLAGFDNAIDEEYMTQLESMGLTLDDAVIAASLIENEVRYPDERPVVASVIYNRIEKGMKLQMDASVLYALGEKKSQVLYSDLEIADGHNTYYVDGLPVGPIGNPGINCLKAAAYPADTDYLYYVLEDLETGQHYFTDDYDDFLAAKERYNNSVN